MCTPCPSGYSGGWIRGQGLEVAKKKQQHCNDIDECAQNNGNCRHSSCINTNVRDFLCRMCCATACNMYLITCGRVAMGVETVTLAFHVKDRLIISASLSIVV